MKSSARLDRAVADIIDQVNNGPLAGLMDNPQVREAFAILHALRWVQGKRMIPPEVRVADLLSRATSGVGGAR